MNDKNNPFETFGIEKLSPSSINTYISSPAKWLLTYLYGYRDSGSPAMWRGNVVDNAVGAYFGKIKNQKKRKSLTLVQEEALQGLDYYRKECKSAGGEIDDNKYEKEKSLIPQFISNAVDHYSNLEEEIETYQEEVYFEDPDLPVPIRGFLDLKYKDVVRDIKTTGVIKSANTEAIKRQVSMYAYVTDRIAIVDYIYCTKYKSEVISVPIYDVKENVEVLKRGALAIMNFLSISDDKNDLAKLVIPDFDDWKWSDEDINEAKQIWRI